MYFKDDHGKFIWKVRCIGKYVDNIKQKCMYCNNGMVNDTNDMWPSRCDYCKGKGVINRNCNCHDEDLEKYLESKIKEYYRIKEEKETNAFISENI